MDEVVNDNAAQAAATAKLSADAGLDPEVARQMEKAVDFVFLEGERYSDRVWLRSLVAAIPGIGGSLDILIAYQGQRIAQDRIARMLASLKEEMTQVRADMVEQSFLQTEEWTDLVVKAVEASAKTRDQRKLRLYAKVLRSSAIVQNRNRFSPEDYLTVLSELSPFAVEVAHAVFLQQSGDACQENESEVQWAKRVGWDRLAESCPSVSEDDLPFILLRLEKSGLVKEATGSFIGYVGGVYTITHAFLKLVEFLGTTGLSEDPAPA